MLLTRSHTIVGRRAGAAYSPPKSESQNPDCIAVIILVRDLQENKIPIFEREGWLYQPSLSKIGILLIRRSLKTRGEWGRCPHAGVPPLHPVLRIENKIEPRIFDEKRDIAALLIKNSGFYFVRGSKPDEYSYKTQKHFL